MPENNTVFHIAHSTDVATLREQGTYRCESLDLEGFIHCCDRHQLQGVVSRYYNAVDNVHLLMIDVDRLDAALIHENTVGGSELFPHIYGPINANAVLQIIPFGLHSPERTGLFE